jgi:hypothetical protein
MKLLVTQFPPSEITFPCIQLYRPRRKALQNIVSVDVESSFHVMYNFLFGALYFLEEPG